MRHRVEDPNTIVPSKTELGSRWVGWVICTGVSLVVYIVGLTGMGV